jgi:hypothetical protein
MSEQSPGDPVPRQQGGAASAELHCPRCGGPARRIWNDAFVFNLATLLIFGALSLCMLRFFVALASVLGGVLALVWAGIVLISLCMLPVTGALAVAARPRCCACGYRFWPGAGPAGGGDDAGFPVRFAVAAGTLLLSVLGLGMIWLVRLPGRETDDVTWTIGTRMILAVLILGAGFLGQAILWRRVRTATAGPVRQGVMLLLPALVLGAGWLALAGHDRSVLGRKYDPVARASRILARAQLADLPPSARGVAVYSWGFMLSGRCYLRFAAEPNDIERFLADSPTLKGVPCQRYSRERMRIKCADYHEVSRRSRGDGHEYFYATSKAPAWYREEIRGAARRYEINPGVGIWRGELIADDEPHVIYLHLDHY